MQGPPAEADQQRLDKLLHIAEPDTASITEHFPQITLDLLNGLHGSADTGAVVASTEVAEPAIPVFLFNQSQRRNSKKEELISQFGVAVGQGLPRFQKATLFEMVEGGQLFRGFMHAVATGKNAVDDLFHAQFQFAFAHSAVPGTCLDTRSLFDQFFRKSGRTLANVPVQLHPRSGEFVENPFQERSNPHRDYPKVLNPVGSAVRRRIQSL